jgi:menaquinone-dependent protoporphyrinogen oxidase
MARWLIVFGTTEGQTRKIAERAARLIRKHGDTDELMDAGAPWAHSDPARFDGVIVLASVHQGRHQTAVEQFVERHIEPLNAMPAAFVSVSLAAAGTTTGDRQDASDCANAFLAATGWHPTVTHMVAGALRYTEYDFFKRWIMKLIARQHDAPTDTSSDHEFTDWDDFDAFVEAFVKSADEAPKR